MIARRCVPELETHTAFEGINDGVKVTRKTVDRQIAMTYVWVVRFDDRQKVRVRTRDPRLTTQRVQVKAAAGLPPVTVWVVRLAC